MTDLIESTTNEGRYAVRWEHLVGQRIDVVEGDADGLTLLLAGPTGNLWEITLSPEGDCCAQAYMDDFSVTEMKSLVGATIAQCYVGTPANYDDSWANESPRRGEDVHDVEFYTFVTDKFDVTVALHVDHNGYYGGWINLTARSCGRFICGAK